MTARGAIIVLLLTDIFMFIHIYALHSEGYTQEAASGAFVTLAVSIAALLVFICMPFWDD